MSVCMCVMYAVPSQYGWLLPLTSYFIGGKFAKSVLRLVKSSLKDPPPLSIESNRMLKTEKEVFPKKNEQSFKAVFLNTFECPLLQAG